MTESLNKLEKERYQRAILEIGEDFQGKLKEKTVLQVGAGGLGSPLSLYLVASGVGNLIIFENDFLDLSNLGRQIIYDSNGLGKSKAKLAKERLNALNPNVNASIIEDRLTKENAHKYMEDIDYLVDASDNFDTKYLINDLALKYNIKCTIAGIQGFDGQIVSVIPHKTACYRCCFGEPNDPKYLKSEREQDQKDVKDKPLPIMAPTCGVVGSLEANEVLKGLLNMGKPITNGILMISLRDSGFSKVPIKINPNCFCQKFSK